LGTLGGGHASFAYAINDAGQVAGGSTTADSGYSVATLWSGGTAQNLGTLGGIASTAAGINDAGLVRRLPLLATGAALAVIWDGNNGSRLHGRSTRKPQTLPLPSSPVHHKNGPRHAHQTLAPS